MTIPADFSKVDFGAAPVAAPKPECPVWITPERIEVDPVYWP